MKRGEEFFEFVTKDKGDSINWKYILLHILGTYSTISNVEYMLKVIILNNSFCKIYNKINVSNSSAFNLCFIDIFFFFKWKLIMVLTTFNLFICKFYTKSLRKLQVLWEIHISYKKKNILCWVTNKFCTFGLRRYYFT